MTLSEQKKLAQRLCSIAVFRGVLQNKAVKAFIDYLKNDGECKAEKYGQFVYSLSEYNNSFAECLERAVYEDENVYIVGTAKGKKIAQSLKDNALAELQLFSSLTALDSVALCGDIDIGGYVAKFDNRYVNFVTTYKQRLKNISKYGYGIFASKEMFKVVNGEIVPVESADEICFTNFVGYEEERQKVIDNTRALICGKPAANVLLFGDAGTGKSSTVKACVNEFYEKGLRLIEIRKDQLLSLATVMGRIADNPLKFIIFIDDLSFNKNDDSFSMLKAALEGSASAKAQNAVIYATSNRRHIVKETFADRTSTDDVHRNDTMQELLSLSDRFGLTVYFGKPDKRLYLQIVHVLANKLGVNMPQEELDVKAEAFAIMKGSRSPRAAEQFINSLI